jgi:2-keto-myo-inositol isomerase
MPNKKLSRRKMIGCSAAAMLGSMSGISLKANALSDQPLKAIKSASDLPFRISLNTSTIRAYKLSIEEQINMVADAGFDGIELWVRDVEAYLNQGGNADSIADMLKSRNLILENMIGFAPWFSEDAETRSNGMDKMRREMEMTAKIGGKNIAAPIQGVKSLDKSKFADYAQRYQEVLNLSDQTGVVPILELWGHGALNSLADCAHIVIGSGHPKATMLLDFYHLYRGGNDWDTLDCINGSRLSLIHINDYPADPPFDQLRDSDRVFPGDGICPFNELIPKLYNAGFRGGFSVELFNKEYWDTMDAQTVLRESYERTYGVLKEAMSGIKNN